MTRKHEKAFNDVQASILALIETFEKRNLLYEWMLCFLLLWGSVLTNSFHHNRWSDVVDISVESSANPVMFLESIRVVEAHDGRDIES